MNNLSVYSKIMIIAILNFTSVTIFSMQLGEGKLEGWEKNVYSPEIFSQLVEIRSQQSLEEIQNIKLEWKQLLSRAYSCIDQAPSSEPVQQILTEWMDLANKDYKNNKDVQMAKSLAYKNNQIPGSPFDQRLWDFIEKAAIYKYQQPQKK